MTSSAGMINLYLEWATLWLPVSRLIFMNASSSSSKLIHSLVFALLSTWRKLQLLLFLTYAWTCKKTSTNCYRLLKRKSWQVQKYNRAGWSIRLMFWLRMGVGKFGSQRENCSGASIWYDEVMEGTLNQLCCSLITTSIIACGADPKT